MKPFEDHSLSYGSDLAEKIRREAFPAILPSIVPIFGKQDGIPILNGTGVLLQIADKNFLISAAHVLDYATIHNVPYFIGAWQQGQPPVSLGGMRVVTSAYPENRTVDDADLRDDDPFDIGVAILPPEILPLLSGRRFLNLAEIDGRRRTLDASYLRFGFPLVFSEQKLLDAIVNVQALPYFTNLFDGSAEYQHRNANILVAYGPNTEDVDEKSIQAPDPKGLSGCGIWRLNDPSKTWEIWSPKDVKLVGIEHRQSSRKGYLVGTWIAYALDLIFGEFSDLRSVLRLYHAKMVLQ